MAVGLFTARVLSPGRTRRPATAALLIALALLSVSCTTVSDRYTAIEQFDHRGRRRHVEPALTVERIEEGERVEEREREPSGGGSAGRDGRRDQRGDGRSPESRIVVTSPWLPGTEIAGIAEARDTGGWTVYVTSMQLFANWSNGWTEAVYEASGILVLAPADGGGRRGAATEGAPTADPAYTFRVDEPVELWTLEEGSIRYYDTYLLGDDGLTRVRARIDRLTEVARWMRDRGGPVAYGSDDRDGRYGPAMAAEVRRAVRDEIAAGTAPEWLVTLDASRSLERDLREASRLLVALYNLEHFNGELAGTLTLRER